MTDNLNTAHMLLLEGYFVLFRKRWGVYALTHGFWGTEIPDNETRNVVDELCEALRTDCHLTDEQHNYLKGQIVKSIFSAKQKYWVKS